MRERKPLLPLRAAIELTNRICVSVVKMTLKYFVFCFRQAEKVSDSPAATKWWCCVRDAA
jgi:hypothetical protein